MTSVEGYIAREKGYDTPTRTIKYLLYSGFEGKKGLLPAVMLFFKMEAWDVEVSGVESRSRFGRGEDYVHIVGVASECTRPLIDSYVYR